MQFALADPRAPTLMHTVYIRLPESGAEPALVLAS